MDELWIQGVLLGFAIAAPVGPIGILCIQRTLNFGRWQGIASGLGAATADALYGMVAAFSLTALTAILTDHMAWIQLIGGLFLLYLGIKTMRQPAPQPSTQETEAQAPSLGMAYLSTLLLTLTNPATILSFSLIFAGFGLSTDNPLEAIQFVGGVFIGSSLWWLILSSAANLLRARLTQQIHWLNRIAGVVLIGFALISFMV